MKKILAVVFAAAFFFVLTVLAVSAQEENLDLNMNGINDTIESAIAGSPEVSSLVDQMNAGVNVDSDRLLDALQNVEGLDVDQFLQGLQGLDENDGLVGKLASVLGPNSNGLSGILSKLGESFSGFAGSLDIGGNSGGSGISSVFGGLLNGLGDLTGVSPTTPTQAPTVHTTASSYTLTAVTPYTQAATPSTYTYTYSNSVSTYTPAATVPAVTVNVAQYTVPYTAATTAPVFTTASVSAASYTEYPGILAEPTATMPAYDMSAFPVSEASATETTAKKRSGWKKAVGAVLVLGAFAGIAAVVIKKSM